MRSETMTGRVTRGQAHVKGSLVLTLVCTFVAAVSSGVQAQAATTPKRVTAIANVRLRSESWNWFDSPDTNDSYTYIGGFLRFGARQDRTKWSWLVEAAVPYLFNLPDDAIAPPPQGAAGFGGSYKQASGDEVSSIFLKQGFATFKLGSTPAVKLRAGRFEFSDAGEGPQTDSVLVTLRKERIAERLVGPFGFTHIGRSFDGLELRRTTKLSDVTLLAARTTQGVFNLRGLPDLPVAIAYAALTRADTAGNLHSEWRAFALGYRDGRDLPKSDNRPASTRLRDSSAVQILTFGGNLIAVSSFTGGKADVLVWGALQTGDWGALDHSAFGFALEAGVQWKVKHLNPWLRIGAWRGSGDHDPLDGDHGTFFQVLPTPRVYARFPFYNLMNNQDFFVELLLRPAPKWTIRSDVHVLQLTSAGDAWYTGGGAFERESFGYVARPAQAHPLARLIDTSIDYRATEQFSFTAYAAQALPYRVIDRTYPGTSAGLLAYLEARWRR
jgi:hypothetical protein